MNDRKMTCKEKVADVRRRTRLWLQEPDNRAMLTPWIVFGVCAVLCYLFFCYQDILATAQHAYSYLDGRIIDFYSASNEMDGNAYGANYLPTTFILFAVWNLPLKLFGAAPAFACDWSLGFVMWNKLLPTLFLFGSAVLMYRLALDRLHFGRTKALLAGTALLLSPYAFFSQFLFCLIQSSDIVVLLRIIIDSAVLVIVPLGIGAVDAPQ